MDCRLTHWTAWSECSPATQVRDLLRILPPEIEEGGLETEDDDLMEGDIRQEPVADSMKNETETDMQNEEERIKRQTSYGVVAVVAEVVAPVCMQNRTRTIEISPTTGGRQCKGEGYEERFCSDLKCQGK